MIGDALFCHLDRSVARAILRDIGVLLLLVDDNQAQSVQRRKDRAARADNDLGLPTLNLLPLL